MLNNVRNIRSTRRHSKRASGASVGVGVKVGCAELSRAVGITEAHASYILNGLRIPSLPLAKKIAAYLGISLDEFVRRVAAA